MISKFPNQASPDEIRQMFKDIASGPPGLTGLTRGLVALTLLLTLAFVAIHMVVFQPAIPELADKLIMLLAGTLTSVIGFYFGSKAASEGAAKPQTPPVKNATAAKPSNVKVDPPSAAAGNSITLTGQGFGQGEGTVLFNG